MPISINIAELQAMRQAESVAKRCLDRPTLVGLDRRYLKVGPASPCASPLAVPAPNF